MQVKTNLPGLQVYGAYHLKTAYPGWHAICLEPENFPGCAESRELPEQHPAARRDASIVHEFRFLGVTSMKTALLILTLLFAAHERRRGLQREKRSRDPLVRRTRACPTTRSAPAERRGLPASSPTRRLYDAAHRQGRAARRRAGHAHQLAHLVFRGWHRTVGEPPDRVIIESVRYDGKQSTSAAEEEVANRQARGYDRSA